MTDQNHWQPFLLTRGATIRDGIVQDFGETRADYPGLAALDTLYDLGDLGVLAVNGPRSAAFLQGQTTADFQSSPPTEPIRGACCNPQGRVFTLFTALQTDTGYLLIMPRALVEPSRRTLAPYAALSRVELTDLSADHRLLGLAGPGAGALVSTLEERDGGDDTKSWRHHQQRYLLLVPAAVAEAHWEMLQEHARPVGLPLWHLADIRAGIASLCPATSAQFLPQMLGLDRRGAVSFTKGCYTGQEVVARSQHLGKLKRQLVRLAIETPDAPAAGTQMLAADSGQPAGIVLMASSADDVRCEALAVVRDEAVSCTVLDFGDGPRPVTFLPLPDTAE